MEFYLGSAKSSEGDLRELAETLTLLQSDSGAEPVDVTLGQRQVPHTLPLVVLGTPPAGPPRITAP